MKGGKNVEKDLAEVLFQILQKREGSEVVCLSWYYGVPVVQKGLLKEVVPFDYVNINDSVISFVGEHQAIETITLSDGRTIYSNPRAKGYYMKDPADLMNQQEKMLGYSVAKAELEKTIEAKQKVLKK